MSLGQRVKGWFLGGFSAAIGFVWTANQPYKKTNIFNKKVNLGEDTLRF